jgi:hypothetical protein
VLGALDDAVEDQRPAVVLSAKGKNNGGNTGISKITVYPRKNNFIAEQNVYARLFLLQHEQLIRLEMLN